LWLDRTCVDYSFDEVTDELIGQWVNMPVTRLFVEARPEPISPELANFIRDHADWPRQGDILKSADETTRRLAREYQQLGWRILRAVVSAVNRFIAWVYAQKLHYWLHTRDEHAEMMMSRNAEFRARVSIDSGPSLRWCPPSMDKINVGTIGGERGLRAHDWAVLGDFLRSNRRPDLVGELLSNAAALVALGHHRAALIEAVSALEVALRTFARQPDPAALKPPIAGVLDSSQGLRAAVDHLGLSCSLRHLLPVVLAEAALPSNAHKVSCTALDTRQNVVHNGQREVDRDQAQKFIHAITAVAQALQRATLADAPQ